MQVINIELLKNSKYKALFASFCAIGWSLAYPLIKLGYSEFQIASDDLGSKVLFAGIRFFAAGLIIICFCLAGRKIADIKSISNAALVMLFGLVNTALHYMFAYIGLGYNSGSRSTILDSSGSFMLIILSTIIFKDDKMTAKKGIGCLLGFCGIILATLNAGENIFADITFRGDGMILLNAVFAAIGGILTRIVSKRMNMLSATGISMAFGGAVMIILGLIFKRADKWNISIRGVAVLFILIMISAVCFAVYNELIANHPISEISIFNALIPVLGVVFSSIILREELKWQYICSVIIVSVGIYLVNKNGKTKNRLSRI